MAQAIANAYRDYWIYRTMDLRRDRDGKKFRRLSPQYKKFKRRFKQGKSKSRLKNKIVSSQFRKGFGANLNLTGELAQDMIVEVKQARAPLFSKSGSIKIELSVNDRSGGKARGLIKGGRNFFGFKTIPNQLKKELQNIIDNYV